MAKVASRLLRRERSVACALGVRCEASATMGCDGCAVCVCLRACCVIFMCVFVFYGEGPSLGYDVSRANLDLACAAFVCATAFEIVLRHVQTSHVLVYMLYLL